MNVWDRATRMVICLGAVNTEQDDDHEDVSGSVAA
jgi:hypothetical protein